MCHLRNYTGPIFQVCHQRQNAAALLCLIAAEALLNLTLLQRYIVRLIFMIPVYSVSSFLSFINPGNAIWYDSVRDW